jgi:hypothetical protein
MTTVRRSAAQPCVSAALRDSVRAEQVECETWFNGLEQQMATFQEVLHAQTTGAPAVRRAVSNNTGCSFRATRQFGGFRIARVAAASSDMRSSVVLPGSRVAHLAWPSVAIVRTLIFDGFLAAIAPSGAKRGGFLSWPAPPTREMHLRGRTRVARTAHPLSCWQKQLRPATRHHTHHTWTHSAHTWRRHTHGVHTKTKAHIAAQPRADKHPRMQHYTRV